MIAPRPHVAMLACPGGHRQAGVPAARPGCQSQPRKWQGSRFNTIPQGSGVTHSFFAMIGSDAEEQRKPQPSSVMTMSMPIPPDALAGPFHPTLEHTAARAAHWHAVQLGQAGRPYIAHLIQVAGGLVRMFPDAIAAERHGVWPVAVAVLYHVAQRAVHFEREPRSDRVSTTCSASTPRLATCCQCAMIAARSVSRAPKRIEAALASEHIGWCRNPCTGHASQTVYAARLRRAKRHRRVRKQQPQRRAGAQRRGYPVARPKKAIPGGFVHRRAMPRGNGALALAPRTGLVPRTADLDSVDANSGNDVGWRNRVGGEGPCRRRLHCAGQDRPAQRHWPRRGQATRAARCTGLPPNRMAARPRRCGPQAHAGDDARRCQPPVRHRPTKQGDGRQQRVQRGTGAGGRACHR